MALYRRRVPQPGMLVIEFVVPAVQRPARQDPKDFRSYLAGCDDGLPGQRLRHGDGDLVGELVGPFIRVQVASLPTARLPGVADASGKHTSVERYPAHVALDDQHGGRAVVALWPPLLGLLGDTVTPCEFPCGGIPPRAVCDFLRGTAARIASAAARARSIFAGSSSQVAARWSKSLGITNSCLLHEKAGSCRGTSL